MKRLTVYDEYGNADIIGVDISDLQQTYSFKEFNLITDALNRLAAYEDTGKEPKEIYDMAKAEAALERGKNEN